MSYADPALNFCKLFTGETDRPKYILGRNIYSECVANLISIEGFIDDFTNEESWRGLPVVSSKDLPPNSLVLNAAGGRPLSARRHLNSLGITNLDYFKFYSHSNLPLIEARFNEGFSKSYLENVQKFENIYNKLSDEASRVSFANLVSFRRHYDIRYLSGFFNNEKNQYFEDFLNLNSSAETFVDVGAYDGATSIRFMELCPNYSSVHLFEPDPGNFRLLGERISQYPRTILHNCGASDRSAVYRISCDGSNSVISDQGDTTVNVERIDDVITGELTFLKLDIEGAECEALEGARETITKHHPRIAVAAYHRIDDFWRIPEVVFSMRDEYRLYLRHYTESIYETVLFFVPSGK